MGGDDRRRRQPGDDVAGAAASRLAAQKKSLIAAERDEAARAAWRVEAATLDPADLVFVDETSTHTALTRRRARAPRGERAVGRTPRNHGPNVTLLAALTPAGIGPAVAIPGAVDGAAFVAYAEQVLAPSLRPGQVVVLDNLSAHKSEGARTAVEAVGARLLFLPAYSPEFQCWLATSSVCSIAAAIADDWDAARDVRLVLPETGVCSSGILAERGDACCAASAALDPTCTRRLLPLTGLQRVRRWKLLRNDGASSHPAQRGAWRRVLWLIRGVSGSQGDWLSAIGSIPRYSPTSRLAV